MRTLAAIVVLLMGTAFRPIAAQWHIGLELATTHYGGSARDTSGGHVASHGRPGDATMVGTRFGRDGRRYGIALRASYATTGLTVAGRGVSVTDRTTGRLLELGGAGRAERYERNWGPPSTCGILMPRSAQDSGRWAPPPTSGRSRGASQARSGWRGCCHRPGSPPPICRPSTSGGG